MISIKILTCPQLHAARQEGEKTCETGAGLRLSGPQRHRHACNILSCCHVHDNFEEDSLLSHLVKVPTGFNRDHSSFQVIMSVTKVSIETRPSGGQIPPSNTQAYYQQYSRLTQDGDSLQAKSKAISTLMDLCHQNQGAGVVYFCVFLPCGEIFSEIMLI